MSYINDKEELDNKQIEYRKEESSYKKGNKKKGGALKTIISGDTTVESPQDIIDRDPDIERRNAFKRAYEILLAIFPETIKKKKNKKEKEKQEFDRNLQYMQKQATMNKQREEKNIQKEKDKGIERGE